MTDKIPSTKTLTGITSPSDVRCGVHNPMEDDHVEP